MSSFNETLRPDLSVFWELDPKEHRDIVEKIGDTWDKSSPDFTFKTLELSKAAAICRWYNGLKPTTAQQLTGLSKMELLTAIHVHEDVKSLLQGEALPFWTANQRKFSDRFARYKKQGWRGLLSERYGNKNSLKIKSEEQKALIRQLYARTNNQDSHKVALLYNEAAKLYDWPAISHDVVKQIVGEAEPQLMANRTEAKKWRTMFDQSIDRMRPSQPGYMWVLDGWDVELMFQEEVEIKEGKKKGKIQKVYNNRWNCCFVIDAFNDTILGVSADREENGDMIIRAVKMAVENTGITPWQIQSDHFAIKRLTPIMQALAWRFTPARVGNAQAKVIESFFRRFKDDCIRDYANWSGSGVTARLDSSQPNTDFLKEIKKDFPDAQGNLLQVIESIDKWNNHVYKVEGTSRMDHWLTTLKALEQNHPKEVRPATNQALIDIFGQERKSTYKYDAQDGLDMVIKGQQYKYKIWDQERSEDFLKLINKSGLVVRYLPDDLSMIRVSDTRQGEIYYIPLDEPVPMCIKDYKPGDRQRIQAKMDFKKLIQQTVIGGNKSDMALLEKNHEDIVKLYLEPINGTHKHHLQQAESYLKRLSEPDPYDMDIDSEQGATEEEEKDIYEQIEIPGNTGDSI